MPSNQRNEQGNKKGIQEERFAEQYLQERGLAVKQRNYHCRFGEIDLIMLDKSTLVFVEVRQRKQNRFGTAAESVTQQKQTKLRKTAEFFLMENPKCQKLAMRFDVLAISGTLPSVTVDWFKNAF